MQVLGSGGPVADDARASSGYLVWLNGQSKLLVDAGGGIFLRFGEVGAQIEDLDLIAITHLHTDHVADLPALLKSGFFTNRTRPLLISGPSGSRLFPGINEFLQGQFDPEHGVFRYLSGYLDGSGGLFKLGIKEIPEDDRALQTVINSDGLLVQARGVHHGIVPALAYRVKVAGKLIAFSGDLSGDNLDFAKQIKRADLLFVDHAIPEDTTDRVARALHISPSDIGRLAHKAQARNLILSHRMARSLGQEKETLEAIRDHFAGRTVFAEDLECIKLID